MIFKKQLSYSTNPGKLLRVISARDMNSREKKFYEEKQ